MTASTRARRYPAPAAPSPLVPLLRHLIGAGALLAATGVAAQTNKSLSEVTVTDQAEAIGGLQKTYSGGQFARGGSLGILGITDLMNIPFSIRGLSDAAADRVMGWVFEHYGFIQSKVPRAFLPRAASFAGGCSTDRLAKARTFFSDPAHLAPGIEKRLEQVSDQVRDCDGLRSREGAAVGAYLQGLSAGP